MERNMSIKKIISILLLLLLIITTKVYATNDSFETTLKANGTQFKAGDSITVTIGLNNIAIEGGDKGIGSYTGHIKFDSSVLEYVSTSGTNKWYAPFYADGLITAMTTDGEVVDTTQNIGTITFKVKEKAKLGETTISLENFSGSNAIDDVFTNNKSMKITIVDNVNDDTNNGDKDNNDNINNGDKDNNDNINNGDKDNNGDKNNNSGNSNNNSNQSSNNNASKVQNVSGSKDNKLNVVNTNKENIKSGTLPKAGKGNIIIFTAIGSCILLAMILYIRVRVIDGKMKNGKK